MGYTVENADFGYFGYCEIKGFWIKSWFLDKSVLFWGGFPGSMSGKPGSGRGQDSILGLRVWVILIGIAVQGLGQVLGWAWPGRRSLGWGGQGLGL